MKKIIVIWSMLAVLLSAAYGFAQMGGEMMGKQKGEMKQQGVMGEGMMKQDMMQMMMGMMDVQEKMMKGMKPEEKKKMIKDMGQMKEKMQKMMSMHMGMTMGAGDLQAKLACAEQWLIKAIDLHQLHMKDPKTTTDASRMELMDQIKMAHGCITGAAPIIKSAPTKEPAGGEKKKDAHGH